MKYHFPAFDGLVYQQILDLIADKKEFSVSESADSDFVFINYQVIFVDTFPPVETDSHALLRELRGICFNKKTGQCISRPYHKFFNMNEREETQEHNINIEHYDVLQKLDGSMIRPLPIRIKEGDDYVFRLATKAGITDVAMNAETFIADKTKYYMFFAYCYRYGMTPIFEWCSRQNKIVVDYPKDNLILTGMRFITSGSYIPYPTMLKYAQTFDIPCVQVYDIANVKEYISTLQDDEGVVLRHKLNGHMVKVKCDWYLTRHRAIDLLSQEKDIIKLIVEEQLDDLLPTVPVDVQDKLKAFQDKINHGMINAANTIAIAFTKLRSLPGADDKRTFAVKYVQALPSDLHDKFSKYLYRAHGSQQNWNMAETVLLPIIKKEVLDGCTSSTKLYRIRHLIGNAEWI